MASVTVTTAPTLIYADTGGTGSAPTQLVITNNSGATVYLGGPAVTASGTPATDGIALPTAGSLGLESRAGMRIYGTVAAATAEVRVHGFV